MIIISHFFCQVQVRVIEARDLAGMTVDPVVTITLGEIKKHTTVKPQTNNPFWDEVTYLMCADLAVPYYSDLVIKWVSRKKRGAGVYLFH